MAAGQLVRVVDTINRVVTADHAHFWCGAKRCQARDNSQAGSPISAMYYNQGAIIGGTPYYYVQDRLGSMRALVTGGRVAAQYDYDPYGNRTVLSGTAVSDTGYAGYLYHAASGLNFALNRAYDSSHARWLSRDPIAEAGGLNLYAYANGNPISYADPLGLWTVNVGVNISVQVGPVSLSYSVGVVVDGAGDVGAYANPYAGAGVGAGVSAGVSVGGSNAATINDLNGPFAQATVNVGEGPDVAGTVYAGNGSDGSPVVGGEVTVGIGVGAGGSGGGSYTIVSPIGGGCP